MSVNINTNQLNSLANAASSPSKQLQDLAGQLDNPDANLTPKELTAKIQQDQLNVLQDQTNVKLSQLTLAAAMGDIQGQGGESVAKAQKALQDSQDQLAQAQNQLAVDQAAQKSAGNADPSKPTAQSNALENIFQKIGHFFASFF